MKTKKAQKSSSQRSLNKTYIDSLFTKASPPTIRIPKSSKRHVKNASIAVPVKTLQKSLMYRSSRDIPRSNSCPCLHAIPSSSPYSTLLPRLNTLVTSIAKKSQRLEDYKKCIQRDYKRIAARVRAESRDNEVLRREIEWKERVLERVEIEEVARVEAAREVEDVKEIARRRKEELERQYRFARSQQAAMYQKKIAQLSSELAVLEQQQRTTRQIEFDTSRMDYSQNNDSELYAKNKIDDLFKNVQFNTFAAEGKNIKVEADQLTETNYKLARFDSTAKREEISTKVPSSVTHKNSNSHQSPGSNIDTDKKPITSEMFDERLKAIERRLAEEGITDPCTTTPLATRLFQGHSPSVRPHAVPPATPTLLTKIPPVSSSPGVDWSEDRYRFNKECGDVLREIEDMVKRVSRG